MATEAKYKIFNGSSWVEYTFPPSAHTHNNYSTLKNTIKSLSISGRTITYTKGDGSTGTLTTQDTTYTLSPASSTTLGGVMIGSNITANKGTISLTKENVISALGYTPPTSETTYSLVGTNGTTGLIKNGSSVTSTENLTACPIINGVPYYKDTNTTYESKGAFNNGTTVSLVTTGEKFTWNNKADKTHSHSYNDLTDKPTIPTVPTNVSSFTNDAKYVKADQAMTIKWGGSITSTSWLLAWADSGTTIQGISPSNLSVASATKATQDGSGNVISATYATKTELSNADSKADNAIEGLNAMANDLINGDLVVYEAEYAGSAEKDGSGNTITSTYQTKTLSKKVVVNGQTTNSNNLEGVLSNIATFCNGLGSTYATKSHTHNNYLPTTGETIDGDMTVNSLGITDNLTVGTYTRSDDIGQSGDLWVKNRTNTNELIVRDFLTVDGYLYSPAIYVGPEDNVCIDEYGMTINGEEVALKSDIPSSGSSSGGSKYYEAVEIDCGTESYPNEYDVSQAIGDSNFDLFITANSEAYVKFKTGSNYTKTIDVGHSVTKLSFRYFGNNEWIVTVIYDGSSPDVFWISTFDQLFKIYNREGSDLVTCYLMEV